MKIINVEKALVGTPRYHHLTGQAKYWKEENRYYMKAKVFFSSEHPSIYDRTDKYLDNPHVNEGDCAFALWNAAHIIAKINGYGKRTLRGSKQRPIKTITSSRMVPPDTELDLDVIVTEEKVLRLRGEDWTIGEIYGCFSQDGKKLLEKIAPYAGIKNNQ